MKSGLLERRCLVAFSFFLHSVQRAIVDFNLIQNALPSFRWECVTLNLGLFLLPSGPRILELLHDGFRFLIIILKIGALFSPMRFFLPISAFLLVIGLGYYGYTYIYWGRLTNMSAILFLSSLLTFLIGIVSEQVSALHYKDIEETKRRTTR